MKNQCKAALLGLIVGDALGVPAEFKSREKMKLDPITDMEAYGTHNQPAGTWSDDSSMVVATMEWFGELEGQQPDYTLLMEKFNRWLMNGEYTPYGVVFDRGIATSNAVANYRQGVEPLECGGASEWDNGNGSLMRILPAALWWSQDLVREMKDAEEFIYDLSALTHAHLRSKMGCLIYSKLIADMLHAPGESKKEIVQKSMDSCQKHFACSGDAAEKSSYARLWDVDVFANLEEDEIQSSGYVVHTLEAAIWCFLNTDNYKDCVLMAVNLGEDTDTVAAVAGGLAGVYYGLEDIPQEWIDILPKKDWIMELMEKMFEQKKESHVR